MKIEVKSYTSSSSLISSIIFLVLGAILMTNADSIITYISYIIGALLIFLSFFKFLAHQKVKKQNINSNTNLMFTVLFLTLGILCFFLATVFETLVRFLIGAWILFAGLNRLISVFSLEKGHNKSFIAILIVSIFLIGIGLYVILYSNIIFKWVGIAMIVYSILDIIGYLFFTHNKIKKGNIL